MNWTRFIPAFRNATIGCVDEPAPSVERVDAIGEHRPGVKKQVEWSQEPTCE
ncbi:hypothetical protein [Oryzifoliimicrobium ureilyticus]|uniref:hypothetical protein n=1 Tax=Oryzifoliimicrobium ureilyticus TaxID=3113724 RepID=UPI0030761447